VLYPNHTHTHTQQQKKNVQKTKFVLFQQIYLWMSSLRTYETAWPFSFFYYYFLCGGEGERVGDQSNWSAHSPYFDWANQISLQKKWLVQEPLIELRYLEKHQMLRDLNLDKTRVKVEVYSSAESCNQTRLLQKPLVVWRNLTIFGTSDTYSRML